MALLADSYATDRATSGIRTPGDRDNHNTWRTRRDAARTTTYAFGTATVVTAITALGLYLFDDPQAEATVLGAPDKRDTTRFTPMALETGFGVGVTGGW